MTSLLRLILHPPSLANCSPPSLLYIVFIFFDGDEVIVRDAFFGHFHLARSNLSPPHHGATSFTPFSPETIFNLPLADGFQIAVFVGLFGFR